MVVGGGIVGLATALALSERFPGERIVVLEKEGQVALHQTGRNSGVVHSGIYYRPGSLKARLCREGVRLLKEFCEANELVYDECGKVIVATSEAELAPLQTLLERGQANGVPGLRMLDGAELGEAEPNASGLAAVWSPSTAIVDYGAIARRLADELRSRGVQVVLGARVDEVTGAGGRQLTVRGPGLGLTADYLVNCAGLHSDAVARACGLEPEVRIVPFRGEYYLLRPSSRDLVRHLVYPVPDPALPFLGVHFTRTVSGEVEAGPNAVLALAREGYSWTAVDPWDVSGTFGYPGFWHLASRYWRVGAFEVYRSLSKAAFVSSLQRLVPGIAAADLVRGHAGVRAQAVSRDGKLVDDFAFVEGPGSLHVLNAPSPAATASLAIGRHVAERVTLG